MSRCFPYPPPGFQRAAHHSDFLPKENHKKKKHKKEKKEKERKKGKERKTIDRSEDKHKEKKDRREKHKDKIRDKAKDKDKNKTSDHRRIEERADDHNGQKATVSIPKYEEGKDSSFAEELGKRIRYEEEWAAKRMFENISGQIQGVEYLGAAYMWEMERGKGNTMVPRVLRKEERRVDGVGSITTTTALQKERGNGNPTVANFISKEQRKVDGIGGAGQPVEKGNDNNQSFHRLPVEKGNQNHQARLTVEKDNHNHQVLPQLPVERDNYIHQVLPQLQVEKVKHNHQVLFCSSVEKDAIKSVNGKEKKEKDTKTDDEKGDRQGDRDQEEKRNKGKDKIRDKEKEKEEKIYDGKGSMHRDRDHEKKSKGKDKNRDKQKEKEDKKSGKEKNNQKVHNKPKDIGEIDRPDSQNCKLVPQNNKECFGGNGGHSKKRKHIKTNGFLHEDAVWPNKAPKVASSCQQPLEIGKELELGHISSSPLNRHVIPNNVKEEQVIKHKKNGFIHACLNAVDRKPLTADTSTKSVVPKPPHPDSKYLREVYSVPQMEELPERNDQDWLFSGSNPRREPKAESESGESQKVWTKGLQIELVDVFALPYVIPY